MALTFRRRSQPWQSLLSHEDYRGVLTCIEDLHRCRTLADFPGNALRAFSKLIPYTLAGFNEVNVKRGRIGGGTDRPLDDPSTFVRGWQGEQAVYPNTDDFVRKWEKYSSQHPLVNYIAETGDGQAIKISDFLSEREYHKLDLYREMYGPISAEDQMSITIRSDDGIIIALAFNRDQRDYTEIDRIKLNLVRPHLLQAYANAEELTGHLEEKNDLMTALRETGHGLIALNPAGETAHATPGAFECLARYFPISLDPPQLPRPIIQWLRGSAPEPFTAHAASSRLIVRTSPHAKRPLLLLSEQQDRELHCGEPLTAREIEVLQWLAEGKTNHEIAIILGVAAGTAKLHVQHVLAKLGVENRTAAAAFARDAGLIPAPRSEREN
jgi:DNA-binding CsgD family transcriptional regulator